mgnify:FL=1
MENQNAFNPNTSNLRVIDENGRLNYNRSFDISTLPRINGMPVLSDMTLEKIGITATLYDVLAKAIKGIWSQFGVFIPE